MACDVRCERVVLLMRGIPKPHVSGSRVALTLKLPFAGHPPNQTFNNQCFIA